MKRINVVWNLTRMCPFKCPFCCVSAIHIKGFKQIAPHDDVTSAYPGELSFSEQINVLDQMHSKDFSIDFSGGDVFINPKNIDLVLYASEKFGRENVGLSIPGTFTNEKLLKKLQNKVSDIEITLDNVPDKKDLFRPGNYAKIAVQAIKKIIAYGLPIGVQTVLRNGNMDHDSLQRLYNLISNMGVKKWSLLKFFPVGRFHGQVEFTPLDNEYKEVTKFIESICNNDSMSLHFQYLLPHHRQKSFKCRAVKKSIGINPSGYVSACFWALDNTGTPLEGFGLGKVPQENIYDVLKSKNSLAWQEVASNNNCRGYCELLTRM